jgi:succinoglycan biosynthesis transport protein ExoP
MRATSRAVETPALRGSGALENFLPLVPVLQRTKGGPRECGIFAFTSALSGEGVTFVTRELGAALATMPRERVLLIHFSVLAGMMRGDFEEGSGVVREVSPGLWTGPAIPIGGRQLMPDLSTEIIAYLRARFTYVLVDCRSLQKSPEALRAASQVDGIVLVVAAGQSRRNQVQQSQRVLQLASDKLLGCILNKRTYSLPGFLEKHF